MPQKPLPPSGSGFSLSKNKAPAAESGLSGGRGGGKSGAQNQGRSGLSGKGEGAATSGGPAGNKPGAKAPPASPPRSGPPSATPPASLSEAAPQRKPANHHDKFFKQIFSQIRFAREFLKLLFSSKNLSCFDLSGLRVEKDTWANKLADLVLSLPLASHLKAAGELLIFIILEHKSHPDPQFLHQQLFYKTAIHEHTRRSGKLSPVVSSLFYHGKKPWGQPSRFLKGVWGDFFDKDLDFLKKFMIDYEVKIIDTHSPEAQKALQSGELKTIRPFLNLMAGIWKLKTAPPEELKAALAEFGEFSDQKDIILSLADYLESAGAVTETLWRELENELVLEGTFKKGGFMDIQEEIKQRGVLEGMKKGVQQGMQQGMQQGRQEGRQEERRQVILNMLKRGLDTSLIASVTSLTEAEIIKLKNGS